MNAMNGPRVSLTGKSLENAEKMRASLLTMAKLITESGVAVKAFADEKLPNFSSLDIERQDVILKEVDSAVDLLQGSLREGHSLLDTRQLLWRSLRQFGWTPSSDVFDYITEEDTVEIYSLDQIQTFRNLQFFRYISFTLEQIHSQPWYKLTRRQPAAEAAIAEAAAKIIMGVSKKTLDLSHIPEHLTEEVGSLELRRFTIEMRCLSPVYQKGELCAVISVNRTRHGA